MDKKATIAEERARVEREMAKLKQRLKDLEVEDEDALDSHHQNSNSKTPQKPDDVKRIAKKLSDAGVLLKDASDSAKKLDHLERDLQAKLGRLDWNQTWKKANNTANVVGSSVKIVGLTATIASLFVPSLPKGIGKFGIGSWEVGSGVKIASSLSEGARELWEIYLKQNIEQYLKTNEGLLKTLQKFWEILGDLKNMNFTKCKEKIEKLDIGLAQHADFTKHAICVVLGFANYTPLYDFELMMTGKDSNSKCLKIAREIEGWGFARFLLDGSKPKYPEAWASEGTRLHYAVEIYDLMKDVKELTNTQCDQLQGYVNLFLESCQKSRPLVSFLLALHEMEPESKTKNKVGGGTTNEGEVDNGGQQGNVLEPMPKNLKHD